MKLPSGPGTPASTAEAEAALEQATAGCRAVKTLTAEIAASGTAGGQHVRARLVAGVAAPASARLEAVAPFGAPFFVFVATGGDATLLLPRDDRVLEHGRPDAVLEAVAGIPLTSADLAQTLTGCAAEPGPLDAAVGFGGGWLRLATAGGREAFLTREGAASPWRLVSVATRSWRVDYPDRGDGIPAAIRLVSVGREASAGSAFDVRLTLSQVETNTPLDPAAFRVDVPADAVPITLDELRHARPGVREN